MNNPEPTTKFWIGNGILTVALIMLLFMDQLWALLGSSAMVIWIVLAGAGIYYVMNEKDDPPTFPD